MQIQDVEKKATSQLVVFIPQKPKRGRTAQVITNCKHVQAKHYARGMCNYCYHVYGRDRMATKCIHTNDLDYAKGMCHSCYNSKAAKEKKNMARQ